MGIRTDRSVYTSRPAGGQRFRHLHNDNAKLFVMQGPPDAVMPIDAPRSSAQIWFYGGSRPIYLIYEPYGIRDKLWLPIDN
jgi:hypothetical protein